MLPNRLTPRPSTQSRPRPDCQELTPRQKAVWEWMIGFQRKHCIPPAIREICDQFQFASTQAVMSHFRALIKKGFVMHAGKHGGARSRLAVFPDDRCPCCGRKPLGQSEFARKINEPDPGDRDTPAAPISTIPSMSTRDLVRARMRAESESEV